MHPEDGDETRVYLLGRFEVRARDHLIIDQSWPKRKAKALLKLLALNRNGWLHREQILETLWPDLDPAAADHNFRQNLHHLRQAFEEHGAVAPVISAAQSMVGLAPDVWVDVEAFRNAHQAARQVRTDTGRYAEALELYSGELLPEDIYEEWTQIPREELRSLQRQLVLDLASLHELRGEIDAAIQRLESLVRVDNLDEEAHRLLIQLHAESGDRLRAQRQYERCREALQQELGVEPSDETEASYRRALEGRHRAAARRVPAGGSFVGREREIKVMLEGLDKALHSRGGLFMLAGEAGIGKTRTAEEIALHASLRGAQVLWGRCYEGEGAPAYWPWMQALGTYARDHSVEDLRTVMSPRTAPVADLLPELRTLLPDLPVSMPTEQLGQVVGGLLELAIDLEQARFRLFDGVATFLQNAAKRQPILLVLDDLHRSDSQSLLLLEFLASVLHTSRILALGTYRDAELTQEHHLWTSIAIIERLHPGHTIHFDGFSENEVARLMEESTGQQPRAGVAGTVREQTGGNPLLVQELSRVLVAAGLPERALDSPGWGIVLPRGAQAVVLHSMYRLSGPCRRVLAAAAVAGKEFDLNLLARLRVLRDVSLQEAIEEALSAQALVRLTANNHSLSFRHTLFREALYGHLPATRRTLLHRQVAESLEEIYGPDADQHAPELAHHFLEAAPVGAAVTAVRYARKAAERALELFAYEEAVHLYERALDVAGPDEAVDDSLRCDLMLSLGQAKWDAGNPVAGRRAFETAAAIARRRGDFAQLARAALGCGRSLTSLGTVDGPVVELLEEALGGLPREDNLLRAMVMASLARALYWSPQADRRRSLSRQAIELARLGGDDLVLAHVLDAVWIATWAPENPEERLDIATEMLRLAESIGDKARAHQGHRWRMIALLDLGNAEEARREFEAQVEIAHELRHSAQLENAAVVSAMWALFEGRLDEADQLVRDALASAERAHDRAASEQFGAQMIALLREKDRLHEIEPVVRAFVEGNPSVLAWRAVLAWIYVQQQRESDARAEFERIAMDEFLHLHRDYTWLITMSLLSEVCAFLNDQQQAAILYEQLLPFAGRNTVMGYAIVSAGSVSRALGLLARTTGRWREAETHFKYALDMNERMKAWAWLAWTQYEFARMLAGRAGPGDQEHAARLLEQACKNAREFGMTALEARILDGGAAARGQ